MRNLRGLILDVDGTLVDSNELHVQAWVQAFREFGVSMTADRVRPQIGKGGDLLVPDLLDARMMRQFGRQLQDRRGHLFRDEYLQKVEPFPGIPDAIRTLRSKGVMLALASSSEENEVREYVKKLGTDREFAVKTSKSDASLSKPSPEIFEVALDSLGLGDHVFVVGDTPYDILAAHRLALPVVAVRSGGFPNESLLGAEFLVDSVRDLPSILEKLDEWFDSI